jgi:hypothetical protein
MGCGGRRLHPSHPQPCTEVLNPARSPASAGFARQIGCSRVGRRGRRLQDLPFCLDGDALGTERPNRTDHGSPFTLSALAERKG